MTTQSGIAYLRAVASYFIRRAYEDDKAAEMTNMKVQKLLYYAQSICLALYDRPLFSEEIQAWRYGPVCPPAYRFYSEFEADQLPIPDERYIESISDETKKLLDEVWQYFGRYHAYQLSGMTHVEFPWKKARGDLPAEASSTKPIPLDDMAILGQQKLAEIEREHPAYQPVIAKVIEETLNSETEQTVTKGEIRDWLESLLD